MVAGFGGGANLGSARGEIIIDSSGVASAVNAAAKSLDSLDKRGQSTSRSLNEFASNAGLIGAAIGAGVGFAVKTFADFDHVITGAAASLGGVGTAAGITDAQFAALRETALGIGKDTSLSATEAAAAIDVLAKAGVETNDIIEGVAKSTANLAEAIGEGIAPSAEAISAAFAIFNLEASDAADVTDTFTAAINASITDLTDFNAGLRILGPVIASMGGDFEDVAASIAYFTQFGLKGADVGVSLARAIERLAAPTPKAAAAMRELGISAFDVQGNFIGLPAIMDQVNRALGDVDDQTRSAALSLIFGAEAVDVMTIAAREGGDALREMEQTVAPAGQAAEQAAQRMDSLKGALEEMSGAIEVAAIGFGAALAPAIEQVAGIIGSLAEGFAALPGPVQQTAAAAIAAAGGFALVAAAGAKMVSFAIDTAAAWSNMARVLQNNARAMRALSLAFNPATLAIGAIVAITAIAIQRNRAHGESVKDLKQSYEELTATINDLKLAGEYDAARSLEAATAGVDAAITANKEYVEGLQKRSDALKEAATSRDPNEAAATQDEYNNINAEIERLTGTTQEQTEAQRGLTEAFADTRVDSDALLAHVQKLTAAYKSGEISADTYFGALADLPNVTAKFAKEIEGTAEGVDDLGDSLNDSEQDAEDAAKAYETFLDQVNETSDAALKSIAGLEDIGESIDGFQAGFGKAGDSLDDILLRMNRLGEVNLDPAIVEALELSGALKDVQASIQRTEASIAQNADDMSMWAGRISLVDDILGTVEDGYANLNEMVATGRLTQEEANQILQDGIWLRERSVGGLEDEQAAQARNISLLADYARAHDEADGAVNNLSNAQRGFLAAMESSAGATALQTLQLLAYLAAAGLIPPEKVTKFIADASQADPVVKALFDDLGLLPDEKDIDLTVTTTGDEDITNTQGLLDGLEDVEVGVTYNVDSSALGDGTGGPVGDTYVIPTELGAPDTSAVDNVTPDPVEVETTLKAPQNAGAAPSEPSTITTTVTVDDDAALVDLAAFTAAMDTLNGKTATAEVLVKDEAAKADVTAFAAALADLDGKTATAEIKVLDEKSKRDLVNFGDALEAIDGQTATAELLVKDEDSKTDMSNFKTSLDDIDGKESTATLLIADEDAKADVTNFSTSLDGLPDTVTTELSITEAAGNASIDDLAGTLAGWPTAVGTAFTFTLADTIAFAFTRLSLATWPASVATSFSFSQGESAGQPQAIAATFKDWPASVATSFSFSTGESGAVIDAIALALDAFDGAQYSAELDADNAKATTAVADATTLAAEWAATVFTATLAADNGPAAAAYTEAFGWGDIWAGTVFTATFSVDTSPVLAAVETVRAAAAEIAALLPNSPAKEGPLSKPISFDYIAESLGRTMAAMGAIAAAGAKETADAFAKRMASELPDIALQGFLGGDPSRTFGATPAISPIIAGNRGGTTITNHISVSAPLSGNIIGDGAEAWVAETAVRHIVPAVVSAAEQVNRHYGQG